ncbi:MAG: hypothetical protein IJT98_10935 [Prevotella sp.]|nr:hypothetical protein [Prevotella sp.]
MLDKIKLILGIGGILLVLVGYFMSGMGRLFQVGMLLIALWAVITVVTWKKNELSENLIAIVVLLVGGGTIFILYWSRLMEILG